MVKVRWEIKFIYGIKKFKLVGIIYVIIYELLLFMRNLLFMNCKSHNGAINY